jgi:hypothetical protein
MITGVTMFRSSFMKIGPFIQMLFVGWEVIVQAHLHYNIVAYLRHARTLTSKHAPAITQQYTKQCFLLA